MSNRSGRALKAGLRQKRIFLRDICIWAILACVGFFQLVAVVRAATIPSPLAQAENHPRRSVTVGDVIRMTRIGAYSERAQFSPDGKKFVIVVKKGNLEKNTNEYSLLLWHSAEVFSSPSPIVLVKMSSSSNRPAIGAVSWLADGQTIAFLGEHPGELQQLYSYDLRTKQLRKITNHPTNLHSYSVTPDAIKVAFSAETPCRKLFGDAGHRFGVVVSKQALVDLVRGSTGGPNYDHDQLFFQSSAKAPKQLSSETSDFDSIPALSPDGRMIAIAAHLVQVPTEWREYADPTLRKAIDLTLQQGNYQGLQEYMLIDTSTGANWPLLGSPLSTSRVSEAAWSPDGRSIVLTNVFLPLDNKQKSGERDIRKSQPFTAEVNISTGEITPISPEFLYGVEWGKRGDRLTAHIIQQQSNTFYGIGSAVYFYRGGKTWTAGRLGDSVDSPPEVSIQQDLHTPPVIAVTDNGTHRRRTLWELNPNLNKLLLGKVEEVEWQGTDGHVVKGGLYYPVDYLPGTRYPLVIQTHGWNPHQFWIDGPYTTAFAAQELAGHNVMVLQADMSVDDLDSPKEAPREMASYEGAIDYLDRSGLIDRDRVGIIGYSRSCFHVKYTLTHSKYKFVTASVTDGVDGGYFQYILSIPSNQSIPQEFENIYGGAPFGEGSLSWVQSSPEFNADKLHTPTLITALGPLSVLFEWEWFAALTRLRKPVDMLVIEDGSHVLEKPWDRMISQQGNVDWFCFWLKGEEDPDPAKKNQYARWRTLRKTQRENNGH